MYALRKIFLAGILFLLIHQPVSAFPDSIVNKSFAKQYESL